MVDSKAVVYDIGCDHALLDIYLTLYNKNRCVASDINENALKGASENIKKYDLKQEIEVVLSDGLRNLKLVDNSTVIICGMGSSNILKILDNEQVDKIDTLIIQSNTELYNIRKKIVKLGFYIDDEKVVLERGIYYVIIKFKRGKKNYRLFEYKIGPIILKNKDYNYISHLVEVNEKIYNKLPKKYFIKKVYLKYINHKLKKSVK